MVSAVPVGREGSTISVTAPGMAVGSIGSMLRMTSCMSSPLVCSGAAHSQSNEPKCSWRRPPAPPYACMLPHIHPIDACVKSSSSIKPDSLHINIKS